MTIQNAKDLIIPAGKYTGSSLGEVLTVDKVYMENIAQGRNPLLVRWPRLKDGAVILLQDPKRKKS